MQPSITRLPVLLALIAGASLCAFAQTADLSLTLSGPATGVAGSNVAYTVTVSNGGPDTATSVLVTDPYPAQLIFVSAVQNSGPAFSCTNTPPNVICSGGTLANGASAQFTFTFQIAPATASGFFLTNTAAAASATTDPNFANNTGASALTVSTSADLSITKSGPATASVGSNISYTITVNNAGPSAAAGATVSDTIPGNTSFVSATPSQGSCSGTTTVSCSLGTIASSGSATITLVVHFNSGTSVSNTATVSGTTADPNAANNSATTTTSLPPPPPPPIPTLSGWTMAGLTALLAASGALSMRSRQKARGV